MTKLEARKCGSLCTGRYWKKSKVDGKRYDMLCLKVSKFLVRGEGRCGVHTPRPMRTAGRAI